MTESKASEQTYMRILQSMVWFWIIWEKFYSTWVLSLPHYKTVHPLFLSTVRIHTKSLQCDVASDYCTMVVILLVAADLEYAIYMKIFKILIAFVLIILQQYFPLSITNIAITNTKGLCIYTYCM